MDEGNIKHLCLDNTIERRVCLKWPSIFILNKLSFSRFFLYSLYFHSFILYIFFFVKGASVYSLLYLSDKYEVALDVNKKTICFIIAACTTKL